MEEDCALRGRSNFWPVEESCPTYEVGAEPVAERRALWPRLLCPPPLADGKWSAYGFFSFRNSVPDASF